MQASNAPSPADAESPPVDAARAASSSDPEPTASPSEAEPAPWPAADAEMAPSHADAAVAGRPRHERRSACPIACSLDLLGDRWSLLVIRDLFHGKSRYAEFLASAEGIPTNILADRLRRLEQAGLITSAPYSSHSRRRAYALTDAGLALAPALRALRDWGLTYFPGTRAPD